MRRGPTRVPAVLLAAMVLFAGCSADTHTTDASAAAPAVPHLPAGEAGQVLQRAIDAAGGWQRWVDLHDVSYISTLTVVDPAREVTSDSIGWFKAPLHHGALARMDSIGLPTEVRFGIDGEDTWIVSDGHPVLAPGQLALTRFEMVSSLFWFSLPFSLAEESVTVTYLGEAPGAGGARWLRLRAEYAVPNPAVPGPWFVLYLDATTGLIDHVHGKLTAPFLRHDLWVGQWLRYRDCDGIKKERQRQFYPADETGDIVGEMIAEQFVEHVHFNNGFDAEHFRRPPELGDPERRQAAGDGTTARRGAARIAAPAMASSS